VRRRISPRRRNFQHQAAEKGDEFPPLQLIELHAPPRAKTAVQDIEIGNGQSGGYQGIHNRPGEPVRSRLATSAHQLPDLAAAREEAGGFARDLMRMEPSQRDWLSWSVRVTGEDQQHLFDLPFLDALFMGNG
jgi:hypothetical protein